MDINLDEGGIYHITYFGATPYRFFSSSLQFLGLRDRHSNVISEAKKRSSIHLVTALYVA